jgi:hypothetical protein
MDGRYHVMMETSTPQGPLHGARRAGLGPGAKAAGWLGVLPFALALAGVALAPTPAWRDFAMQAALAWGAVILSFIAAVHWGLALAGYWRWEAATVLGSVLPALWAAGALLLGGSRGLALLVAGFGSFWLYEHHRLGAALPPDYLALRRVLSLAVCALLALTVILSEEVR